MLILIIFNMIGCERQDKSAANAESNEIVLYFGSDDGYLVGETRDVIDLTPRKAIEELIKGPDNNEYSGTLPSQTEIIDVKVDKRIAYVNFSSSLSENMIGAYSSSCGSSLLLYSIVDSLILHDSFGIEKVQILIDGEVRKILAPLAIEHPFEADYDIIKE